MPTIPNPKAIHTAFLSLPKPIKEWLSSENAGFLVGEINDRLGLENEKATVISLLVLRLATQDLDPLDFINELSHQLNVSFETAKSIAQDIEERVLRPIAGELRREVGVDAKLIFFGKPGSKNSQATPVQEMPRPTPSTGSGQTPPKPPAIPLEASPALTRSEGSMGGLPLTGPPTPQKKPEVLKEETAGAPFMLHQETKTPVTPNLAFKIPVPKEPVKPAAPKPPTIKLETPPVRVVHYNDLRTPLSAIGTPKKEINPENMVDLRKFTKPDKTAS